MKKAMGWFMAAALAFSLAAHAHTHLKQSVPAEGSVVPTTPPNIVLKFSEPTRLTALTLQDENGKEHKLVPLPKVPAEEVSVKVPELAPGKYVVTWRAIGADSHVMSGKLNFSVSATGAKSPSAG